MDQRNKIFSFVEAGSRLSLYPLSLTSLVVLHSTKKNKSSVINASGRRVHSCQLECNRKDTFFTPLLNERFLNTIALYV